MAIKNNTAKNVHTKTVSWDENGVAEGSIIYSIGASSAVTDALNTKSHPDYSYLKRTGGSVTFKEADMAEVSLTFAGIDPDADGQVMTTIRASMTQEPIQTHPTFTKWSKDFAPLFDQDGAFKGFDSKITQPIPNNAFGDLEEVDNPKAGITQYLDPSVTFEQSKTFARATHAQLASQIANIGFIDSSFYTGGGIPVAPTTMGDDGKPRNWLLISGGFEEIGDGGKVSKVWKLSGRRQWDSLLYSKSEDKKPNDDKQINPQ